MAAHSQIPLKLHAHSLEKPQEGPTSQDDSLTKLNAPPVPS